MIYGTYFGAVTGFLDATVDHQDVRTAAIGGAVGGALFGVLMGVFMSRQRNVLAEIAGPVPRERLVAVFRATRKGPVPDDPELRDASRRILAYRLSRLDRAVKSSYVIFGALAVLSVILAVTSGPGWFVGFALFFIAIIPVTVLTAARTRKRAALFGVTAADAPPVVNGDNVAAAFQVDWSKVGRWIVRNRYLVFVAALAMTGVAIFRLTSVGDGHGWGEVVLAVILWVVTLWVFVVERNRHK